MLPDRSVTHVPGLYRLIAEHTLKVEGFHKEVELDGVVVADRAASVEGDVVSATDFAGRGAGGMHGYLPDSPAMRASLFIAGPGIPGGPESGIDRSTFDRSDARKGTRYPAPTSGLGAGAFQSHEVGHSVFRSARPAGLPRQTGPGPEVILYS